MSGSIKKVHYCDKPLPLEEIRKYLPERLKEDRRVVKIK